MNILPRKTSVLSLFASFNDKQFTRGRASHWILIGLLCLSVFMPGIAQATIVQAAPAVDPVVDFNVDLNLPVDTTANIDALNLHTSDSDSPPASLTYTIVTNVTLGTLELNGAPLAQNSTFTQADIGDVFTDPTKLTYTVTAPGSVSTDSFIFHVSDGTTTLPDQTFTIHINRPTPALYPSGFSATADGSQITTTWTDVPGGNDLDGYVVVCSPTSVSLPVDTLTPIDNPCGDGSGSQHVGKGVQTVTWDGLSVETTYTFAIFPFVNTTYPGNTGVFYDYRTEAGYPTASATTVKTYSISGNVLAGGIGVMGVLIDAGGGNTAISGEDGSYTIINLTPGDYTLTPSLTCYTFNPAVSPLETVSDLNNHILNVDFDATLQTCIHGTVREGVNPLAGVVISDGSLTAVTSEGGSYGFGLVSTPWSGTLTPAKINYFFTPDRRDYANVTADLFVQSFSAHRLSVSFNKFTAQWNSFVGATGYTLDVATDASFTSFVPGYQGLEVGDVTQVEVTGLSPHTHYFFRVRAHDQLQTDGYSTPVEVLTHLAIYFPFMPL